MTDTEKAMLAAIYGADVMLLGPEMQEILWKNRMVAVSLKIAFTQDAFHRAMHGMCSPEDYYKLCYGDKWKKHLQEDTINAHANAASKRR